MVDYQDLLNAEGEKGHAAGITLVRALFDFSVFVSRCVRKGLGASRRAVNEGGVLTGDPQGPGVRCVYAAACMPERKESKALLELNGP
jgi:hypothetical protein